MADINLTVKMSFSSGEESTLSAHLCAATVQRDPRETPVPAYQVSSDTAPSEPILVESDSFVNLR
jgi:hypothetical protein